jgi:hypothetical protein
MNAKFKINGLDQAIKKLNDLEERARALDGKHRVSMYELLTPSFMSRNTIFPSFEAMLEASGFNVESQEDFEKIPDEDWDRYVASSTSFLNWQAMLEEAGTEWAKTKLGF